MGEPLQLSPPTTPPAKKQRVGGFKQGAWPTRPPFTISKKSYNHYFLIGHVGAQAYQRVLNATEDKVFPWPEYMARRWGPGVFMVESGPAKERSFVTVPDSLAYLFAVEQNAPTPEPAPAVTAPPKPEREPDPLDRFEQELERVERIKKRLGLSDEKPNPPPRPSLADALMNPQVVPHILSTLRGLMPAAGTPPPPEPSAWETLGRHYESLGITPAMMVAELEKSLLREAEAAAAQRAQDASEAARAAEARVIAEREREAAEAGIDYGTESDDEDDDGDAA